MCATTKTLARTTEAAESLTERIVDLARWAPSGDNTQPWRVRTVAGGLELYMLRRPSFLDVDFAGTTIAFGAFCEACLLASTRLLRRRCTLSWGERAATPEVHSGPDAHILFGEEPAGAPPLAAFLTERHTNRRPYQKTSLTQAQLTTLFASVDDLPQTRFALVDDADLLRTLAAAVQLAERTRLELPSCHSELHAKLHWREEAAREDGTGFFVDTLELALHERAVLRLTAPTWALKLGNFALRMSTIGGLYARRQLAASAAVGLLWAPKWSPIALLDAGRALQRVWLAAASVGLAVQVVAGATLLVRRLAQHEATLSRAHRRVLHKAKALLGQRDELAPADDLALMIRFGIARAASARSFRLPPKALIVDAEKREVP